jgi:hypothetical protein
MIYICLFVCLSVLARYIDFDGWYLFQLQLTLCWDLSALHLQVYVYLQAFKVFKNVWRAMHTMQGES